MAAKVLSQKGRRLTDAFIQNVLTYVFRCATMRRTIQGWLLSKAFNHGT